MFRLRCFGRAAIEDPNGKEVRLRSQKHLGLLLYLAGQRGGRHGRKRLASLFWGTEPRLARHSLSQALYDITRCIPPLELHRTVREVGLGENGLRFDGEEFAQAVREERLDEAVELYAGPFAPDLEAAGGEDFERWLDEERHRYRRLAETALLRHMSRCDDQARWGAMCLSATRLMKMNRLSEEAHRAYMRALWLQGDQVAAVSHFEAEEERLEKGLPGGIAEETHELVRRIRRSRPALATGAVRESPRLPMLGREHEFGELKRLLGETRDGEGRLAIVQGEAGMGKTRLLEEFHEFAALEGARVLESRCYSAETDVPFGPVVDGLRELARELAEDEEEQTTYFQLGHLFPEHFGATTAELDGFLGAGAGRRRLYEEVADLIRRSCDAEPIVWLIDDAHWMDASSTSLVHYLVRRLSGHPVMVVISQRYVSNGATHGTKQIYQDLETGDHRKILELGPLSLDDTRSIVENIIGKREDLGGDLADKLLSLSGGTPYFILELLESLQLRGEAAEDGSIAQQLGFWRLSNGAKSLIRNRLSGLSADAIRLLEIVAVADKHANRQLLEDVSGLSGEKLAGIARAAHDAGIIQDANAMVTFSHDVVREYVYQSMGYLQRSAIHAAVGEVLGRSSSRIEPASLAYHFEQAGDSERAFENAIRAASEAVSRHAFKEGESLGEMALRSAGKEVQRLTAKRTLATARIGIGNFEAAASDLEDICGAKGVDAPTRTELRLQRALTLLELARWKEALNEVHTAEMALMNLNDKAGVPLRAEALQTRFKIGMRWPSHEIVEDASIALDALLKQSDYSGITSNIKAKALCNLAVYQAFYDSTQTALRTVTKLEAMSDELSQDAALQSAIVGGIVRLRGGLWTPALANLRRAFKLAFDARDLRYQLIAVNNISAYHLTLGEWEEVGATYERAVELVEVLPDRIYLSIQPGINYADSLFYQDKTKRARDEYMKVLDAVEHLGGCDNGPSLAASLGLCEVRLGNLDEARSYLSKATGSDSETLKIEEMAPQNVFKVAWLQAAIRWIDGDATVVDLLETAAKLQKPREYSETLHLDWLKVIFSEVGHDDALAKTTDEGQDLIESHKESGLAWFVYFSRRWLRCTRRANASALLNSAGVI